MMIVQTMSAHYPERLRRIFMINTPFVFNAFWQLLKVFLDERTKQKIRFVSVEDLSKELALTRATLPAFLGGEHPYVFDGDVGGYLTVKEGPMAHLPREALVAGKAQIDATPIPAAPAAKA